MKIYQDTKEPMEFGVYLVSKYSPVVRALVHRQVGVKSYWLDGDTYHHDWAYVCNMYDGYVLSFIK